MIGWTTVGSLMTKEQRAKTRKAAMNRATARQFHKDLQRELRAATMPDMANDYRAKRRAKRLAANKTRNKNRRLAKR